MDTALSVLGMILGVALLIAGVVCSITALFAVMDWFSAMGMWFIVKAFLVGLLVLLTVLRLPVLSILGFFATMQAWDWYWWQSLLLVFFSGGALFILMPVIAALGLADRFRRQ